MTKYRPERIELTTPTKYAEKFEPMLNKYLHRAAKLERTDANERTVFSFYPTKSEYFLVSILFMAIGRQFGTLTYES